MKIRLTAILVVAGWLGSACVPQSEGNAIKADIEQIKKKLATQKQGAEKERKQLKQVMEQATSLLTRNNADVGAQVERLQSKVAKLTGLLEESSKSLSDLQKKFDDFKASVDVKLEASTTGAQPKQKPVPENKDDLFKAAAKNIDQGKHKEGRRLLRHFINRNAKDARAARAQLMLGDSYFTQQKFAPAIQEYRKIIDQHKKSKVVPDALYQIGMSFYQLKYCSDAKIFLSELRKRHRRHSRAKQAKRVIRLIKKFRRNKRVCLN